MNLENYTKIKPLKKHYILLDNTNNSLMLLKKYDNTQKALLVKLQLIQNKCNIPQIIEIVKENKQEIITIESFIDGITLEEYLNNMKIDNIIISSQIFNNFLTTFYYILKNFKDVNIIHRDIKTSNIIITSNGDFYLIDFDISRIYDIQKDNDTTLFGTRGYAAPEQYGFSQTNFKSDIYSLGKVLEQIYLSMNKNKEIEELIENMINIDFNKRASLEDIKIYLTSKKPRNMTFFISNIYTIFYTFFISCFITYINIVFSKIGILNITKNMIGILLLKTFNVIILSLKDLAYFYYSVLHIF